MTTDAAFPTPANLGIAVYSNNAEAIGNTPLVRINRLISGDATVLAKVESDENQQKGEIVLMIQGFEQSDDESIPAKAIETLKLLADELPLKKASAIAAQIHGLKKNALYKLGLELDL